MNEHIYPKEINGTTYYYLQSSWREKVKDSDSGKTKGSGKSQVKTKSTYLGTAKSIINRLQEIPDPIEIHHRSFGFVSAIYLTAEEIGLTDLLKKYIPGKCYGIPIWKFFILSIINRLDKPSSKEKIGAWAKSTILPDILKFNPKYIHSKSFWAATDEVLSEKELKEKRQKIDSSIDDIFAQLDDKVFQIIEKELFTNLKNKCNLSYELLFYDTTNFFTYIEDPCRSALAMPGHNKEGRHSQKQIGLILCVESSFGIPLFHKVYKGNAHDSKTFTQIMGEFLSYLKEVYKQVDELVLIFDKGNNSEEIFSQLDGKIKWIGSLVLSNFLDLVEIPLEKYTATWKTYKHYELEKEVMGINCLLVMTYHKSLAIKQEHSLQKGISKLKKQAKTKWNEYKRQPKKVPKGIVNLINKNRFGKYIEPEYKNSQLEFNLTSEVDNKRKYFGKTLLFTSDLSAKSSWIIDSYHDKDKVEKGFQTLKDPDLIRWRPMHHWTDTKIVAYGFCCIMSLVIIRVMQNKLMSSGIEMSATVLKEELQDLREVIMIYNKNTAKTRISHQSSIQKKIWEIFDLDRVVSY